MLIKKTYSNSYFCRQIVKISILLKIYTPVRNRDKFPRNITFALYYTLEQISWLCIFQLVLWNSTAKAKFQHNQLHFNKNIFYFPINKNYLFDFLNFPVFTFLAI